MQVVLSVISGKSCLPILKKNWSMLFEHPPLFIPFLLETIPNYSSSCTTSFLVWLSITVHHFRTIHRHQSMSSCFVVSMRSKLVLLQNLDKRCLMRSIQHFLLMAHSPDRHLLEVTQSIWLGWLGSKLYKFMHTCLRAKQKSLFLVNLRSHQ